MENEKFKVHGKAMLEYCVKYLETIHQRPVYPTVEPFYLRELLGKDFPEAPERAQEWDEIIKDIECKIMPGMVHWQHPRFHAHFPSGASYPSILGDIVADTIGTIGFSWASGPSCTELEGVVLDWIGKAMNLPPEFLHANGTQGGGCIQTSASECIFMPMLAARAGALLRLKDEEGETDEGVMLSKLVAYTSKEAHASVEKAAMIAFVKLRILETDEHFCLRGDTVRKAMEQDRKNGLYPFFLSCTLGTSSSCACDAIREIGITCEDYNVWMHVDAAYAGCAMLLPNVELKEHWEGLEYAKSLSVNANKWMLTNFDCGLFWVKDSLELTQALVVDPLYLQHSNSELTVDYRHWGIPLSRRMRSVKLWMVLRTYGIEGLVKYMQEHIRLAQSFSKMVEGDPRFELMNKVEFGLVVFRMKGSNGLNQKLMATILASGKLYLTPASLNEKYVIRFCVCRENACDADMAYAWEVIRTIADEVEKSEGEKKKETQCL